MLTAIIPIDLERRPEDIIKKAINMAKKAENKNVKLIFGLNNKKTINEKKFIKKLTNFSTVEIAESEGIKNEINSSALRNVAFKKVQTERIILLDIDIYPDFDLFNECSDEVTKGKKKFIILPCLYLTKLGSKRANINQLSKEALINNFFSFSRKEYLHLASPSSIIIMQSDDYKLINGFDESFQGHGYEDFDFMIRLAEHFNVLKKGKDFLDDIPHRSPLFAVGFRKYLGEFCLPYLIKKKIALHLFHPRNSDDNYYKSREINKINFAKIHGSNLNKEIHRESLAVDFMMLCKKENKNYQEFSIYFDNKPGHIDRFDTFRRKIKFLFNLN